MESSPKKNQDNKSDEKLDKDISNNPEKKEDKKKTLIDLGDKGLDLVEKYFDYRNKKDENETKRKIKELEIQEKIMSEKLEFYQKRIQEMEEKEKKKEKDEEEKKNKLQNGTKIWNRKEKELIEKFLNEIDFDAIKNILENNNKNIIKESDFDYEFSQIFKEDLKDNEIIKEKHNSIFQSIKNNIKEIQTLNFMIAGFTGAGKSTLTNAILKFNEAEEGGDIDSKTGAIRPYSNPNEVPGIMIYDTIGVETTSVNRNLAKIKEGIEKTFDKYLEDPEKSLHGILYCIKNGNGDNRIEEGEIKFIKELNKIYGDGDILIIVFTQSTNQNSQERKKQLKEKLNNENIEIVEVLVKNFKFNIGDQNIEIKAFGRKNLIEAMKNKCKSQLIKCNIKQIAKKNIQEKFFKDMRLKSQEILKKIKKYELENTFEEECQYILNTLICDLQLNFEDLDQLISQTIENSKKVIKTKLLEENKERWVIKLYKEFRTINNNYDKLLDDSFITENLMNEFDEYFLNKIEEYIKKIIFGKASIKFIEKVKKFFGDIICQNIKDKDIEDIVNSNIDKVIQKIDQGNNNGQEQ